jgi:hypothetical protein
MERLVYRSRAVWPLPAVALDGILQASLARNARDRVTGALGFVGGTYVQLLEGPADSLEALMRRLYADPRHAEVTVLVRAATDGRLVPGWSLARSDLAAAAPRATRLIETGDGLALALLLANLVHHGHTGVV